MCIYPRWDRVENKKQKQMHCLTWLPWQPQSNILLFSVFFFLFCKIRYTHTVKELHVVLMCTSNRQCGQGFAFVLKTDKWGRNGSRMEPATQARSVWTDGKMWGLNGQRSSGICGKGWGEKKTLWGMKMFASSSGADSQAWIKCTKMKEQIWGRKRRWGKVEVEKTEERFMIHLLAPDTRSILAKLKQSTNISLFHPVCVFLASCSISVFSRVRACGNLYIVYSDRETSCYPLSYRAF